MKLIEAICKLKTPSLEANEAAKTVLSFIVKAVSFGQYGKAIRLDKGILEDAQQKIMLNVIRALRADQLPMDNEDALRRYIWAMAQNGVVSMCRNEIRDNEISRAMLTISKESTGRPLVFSQDTPLQSDVKSDGHSPPRNTPRSVLAARHAATLLQRYGETRPSSDESAGLDFPKLLNSLRKVFKCALSDRAERWRADLERAYDIAFSLLKDDIPIDQLLVNRGELAADADTSERKRARDAALSAQKRLREELIQALNRMKEDGRMDLEEAEVVQKALSAFRRRGTCQNHPDKDVLSMGADDEQR
jgi:hypothetical protein